MVAGLGPSTAAATEIVHVTPTPLPATGGFSTLDDGPGCPDNNVCIWGQSNFNGQRNVFDSSWAGTWWGFSDFTRNSAKNRFALGTGRKFKLGRVQKDGDIVVIRCLDPQEEASDPGWFDAFHLSFGGSGKCS